MLSFHKNFSPQIFSKVALALFLYFALAFGANALEQRIAITNIVILPQDKIMEIRWETNVPTLGRVDFGLTAKYGLYLQESGPKKYSHVINLTGLEPEVTYHYRIIVQSATQVAETSDAVFKTKKRFDSVAPIITEVSAAYVTGTTATIQWLTDKPATSEVLYGKTSSYGSSASSAGKTLVHDVTLRGLKIGGTYHYQVRSKDSEGNTHTYIDKTFRTNPTGEAESLVPEITNIRPITSNDEYISGTSAIVSWQTNKLADGAVYYGTTEKLGKSLKESSPRDFFHDVTLDALRPGTLYYFKVSSKDVYGKTITSDIFSFRTLSDASAGMPEVSDDSRQDQNISFGDNAFRGECNVDFTAQGFYGLYYNLTQDMPGMELFKGNSLPNEKIGKENGWYEEKYFSFSRLDNTLKFGGKFFPVNEGKPGDPFHFAVHWRALTRIPKDGKYDFSMTSDDDSWLFIDDTLKINNGGVHGAKKMQESISLTAGYHIIDIYFAERSKKSSHFEFIPDTQLSFYPLPENCLLEESVRSEKDDSAPQPRVLGTEYSSSESYTQATRLIRVQGTPDVYAILNGKKHHISSPKSFEMYQYRWKDIQVVTKDFFDKIPFVRLVRTPQNSLVYYLSQRPNKQWLKIPLPTPSVFVSYPGNYWGDIVVINERDLNSYPEARLVKTHESSAVYLLENKTKRPFVSARAFESGGYHWTEVAEISPQHLRYFSEGEPILE